MFNGTSEMKFYVYVHILIPDMRIFYVGKGSGKRWIKYNKRNRRFVNIINMAKKTGKNILASKIWYTNDEQEAYKMEQYFYERFIEQGHKLSNMVEPAKDKGCPSGVVVSNYTRKKLSRIIIKKWKDPEYRNKCLKGFRGVKKKRKRTIKWYENRFKQIGIQLHKAVFELRKLQKQYHTEWYRENYKQFHSEKSKANWNDPDYARRVKEGLRKRWSDPEYREQMSKKNKERCNDPEYRKKLSKAMKEKWNDPEYREKSSKASKERWNNPEFRKKRKSVYENRKKKNTKSKRQILKEIGIRCRRGIMYLIKLWNVDEYVNGLPITKPKHQRFISKL